MAIDVYSLPAVAQARATLEKYRPKIERGVGQAQTVLEVGGASYLAARLSAHMGGPEGKNILGVPLELAIGAACGVLAMSGTAGRHTEDVLAAGVGAIAAYTARLGFQAGLMTARPPAPAPNAVQGEVGAAPRPAVYVLPQPVYTPALPAPAYAPPPPAPPPAPPEISREPYVSGDGANNEEVGAESYEAALQVLDQYNRR